MTIPPHDFVKLAKMELMFDRAIEAAIARDDTAFREAMAAFWKQSPGSRGVATHPGVIE